MKTKTTKQPEQKHSLKIGKACAVKFTAFCKARGLRIDFATEQALSLWMREQTRAVTRTNEIQCKGGASRRGEV